MERFQGSLVGLAVGDALGAPVEGWSHEDIVAAYGKVTEFMPSQRLGIGPGEHTDDTAMMLCIARGIAANGCFDPEDVASRFLAWYLDEPIGIGRTTWVALGELQRGASWREAGYKAHQKLGGMSAGNGSIMRCAPIGLLDYKNSDLLIQDSMNSSLITHWDPKAQWGAAAINLSIAHLLQGHKKEDLLHRVSQKVAEDRVKEALLAVENVEPSQVWSGAFVLSTLQIALWCFLNKPSFEQAIEEAVNLGGDTDTNAAVCGALAGAYYGISQIPTRWLSGLKAREEIIRLATTIHGLAHQ